MDTGHGLCTHPQLWISDQMYPGMEIPIYSTDDQLAKEVFRFLSADLILVNTPNLQSTGESGLCARKSLKRPQSDTVRT